MNTFSVTLINAFTDRKLPPNTMVGKMYTYPNRPVKYVAGNAVQAAQFFAKENSIKGNVAVFKVEDLSEGGIYDITLKLLPYWGVG